MLKLLMILAGIAFVLCLGIVVACYLAISRESQLPEIEDVEIPEEV
jgi:hypothetical protein